MISQIQNGAIDPSWILALLIGVIGFFLVRTLNKMEQRMDKAEKREGIITKVLLQMLTKLSGGDDFYEELSRQLHKD